MPVAGIDIGSVAAKAVIYEPKNGCLGWAILPTGWNPREAGEAVLAQACINAGVMRTDINYIAGTGYGRISLPFAHKTLTEITCHARGAAYLFPNTEVVVDIGGQDSKVIRINSQGTVLDFVMNDKCAAGTGRFLQVLAGILDMPLEELSLAAARGKPASISSMCAVFAETEIVGLLARGISPDDIAAGVYLSIVRRVKTLASRIPPQGSWTFTGGLATSSSFAQMLAIELEQEVHIPEQPQIVGALGAALTAASLV